MDQKRIYTLGTDRRSEEDFIEILDAYKIASVVDVRRFPTSKIEHFRKDRLEVMLKKEGIGYHYLGKELGGLRKGGYEAYTETEEFSNGIDMLEDIAEGRVTAVICAERFPWKCHRRWIAREMHGRGWDIEHIIDKDRVWIPK